MIDRPPYVSNDSSWQQSAKQRAISGDTPHPEPENRLCRAACIIPFACCLVLFIAVSLLAVLHKGFTYDESNHLNYGTQLVFGHSSVRPINSVMPVTALNAIFMRLHSSLTCARVATILFSVLTAILVFWWALELYGLHAAYLAGLLYLCCPNILAHSGLVTTDIYAAGSVLLAMYCFRLLVNKPSLLHATLSGLSFGFALLAKYTCVALAPLFIIIIVIRGIRGLPARLRSVVNPFFYLLKNGVLFMLVSCFFAVVTIMVINAGNLFEGIFIPLKDYSFRSDVFSSILQRFQWLNPIPVPVSFAWLQGLDWVLHDSNTGTATPNLYLFGELRDPATEQAFTAYYFLVSLFKVPIGAQIIILLAAIRMAWKRQNHDWMRNELFLLVPFFYFFYFFNFSMQTQVGLRHYLVVFPLVFVLAGSALAKTKCSLPPAKLRVLAAILILVQLISVVTYYPHFISYVNEFVTDRSRAYKLFADSNLAWGGDEYYLDQYMDSHPEAVYEPQAPTTGTIVVELNNLVGLRNPETFRWLREKFEPMDTIAGGSYLVYRVQPGDLTVPGVTSPSQLGLIRR